MSLPLLNCQQPSPSGDSSRAELPNWRKTGDAVASKVNLSFSQSHEWGCRGCYLLRMLSSNTAYLSPYSLIICCSPQAHNASKMLFRLQPYSLSSYSTFGGT
jgi:hypothetical protein